MLRHDLLDHEEGWDVRRGEFKATLEGHGLYSTFQFVLRLSPEVHRKLEAFPNGIVSNVDFEAKQAFSTYLHETIHWWQHVGSTYGLMLSLSFPSQMQANYKHLKNLIGMVGFKKPLRRFIELDNGPGGVGTPHGTANTIINNHFDIGSFRNLSVSPRSAALVINDPLFETIGHAYEIAMGNNVLLLGTTADPEFETIPHPRDWEAGFHKVKADKEEGFVFGADVTLPPVGAYEIFEGQARFGQLQFLHFGTGGQFELSDAADFGMLEGVYGKAFDCFLEFTRLPRPPSIDHPVVGLFLLICDMAINSGAGFPFPPVHYPHFVTDIDPGHRFISLCAIARLKCPGVAEAIRTYSRDEYEAVSKQLAAALIVDAPLDIAEVISSWPTKSDSIKVLMAEYETFEFSEGNILPRVMLSHFIAFAADKFKTPEFFCWPGAWMAGDRVSAKAAELFERHGAPFVDKADDDGIFPRKYEGRDEAAVQKTFDLFYAATVTYDMARQWITEPGPFTYDYRWLSQRGADGELKAFADRQFESVFGVAPDSVELLG